MCLVLLNQYCFISSRKNKAGFFSCATPKPLWSLLYSTIALYDKALFGTLILPHNTILYKLNTGIEILVIFTVMVVHQLFTTIICNRLSKNPTCLHSLNFFLYYLQCPRNGSPKFQPSVVSSFGIIVIDSRKSKIIDLYSDYTDNKLQVLTFAATTSVWIGVQHWNLA